jgi:ornithine carbamoyltransferase
MKRDFLTIADLTSDQLIKLLDGADAIKAKPSKYEERLGGKQVALIFEKPSTRTRVSFEVAITSMGGRAIVLRSDELQLGRGETIEDTGRVLSRYVDAIVVRTFAHERLERLAAASSVPIVNSLSDYSHPCQALGDLQTIREEFGRLDGLALGYIGDGNNVAHSLMFAGALAGMHVRVATPAGHEPQEAVRERAAQMAAETGGTVTVTNVVAEAATGAHVLYTDVWASMGQEQEAEARKKTFANYRITSDSLSIADRNAIVMHCLPAHRGEEITDEVIDGSRSVVFDQAENRLHAQKALLLWLLGD